MTRLLIVLFAVFSVWASACAPAVSPGPQPVPEPLQHVAEVHKAKCGNCHVRVEPRTRTREELGEALLRHKKRVHLTDEEWSAMIEYLARPASG
jgi:hypothetical protein